MSDELVQENADLRTRVATLESEIEDRENQLAGIVLDVCDNCESSFEGGAWEAYTALKTEKQSRIKELEAELDRAKSSILQLTNKYTEADNLLRMAPNLFRLLRIVKRFRELRGSVR